MEWMNNPFCKFVHRLITFKLFMISPLNHIIISWRIIAKSWMASFITESLVTLTYFLKVTTLGHQIFGIPLWHTTLAYHSCTIQDIYFKSDDDTSFKTRFWMTFWAGCSAWCRLSWIMNKSLSYNQWTNQDIHFTFYNLLHHLWSWPKLKVIYDHLSSLINSPAKFTFKISFHKNINHGYVAI